MLRTVPAALLLAAASTAASPADMITATTVSLALKQGPISIGATHWRCTGSTCTGPTLNNRLGEARGCRELARMVGAVASYQGTRGPLKAEDLAKCNEHAAQGS